MSIGFPSSSVFPSTIVLVDFPCLFPRSWHYAAKTIKATSDDITEILCGSMTLGCCVSHSVWKWMMYKHEGHLYKKVLLWDNVVYQAPYDPEEKDMTQEEYRAHETIAWEAVKRIPHTPHIGYASLELKERQKFDMQWHFNRFTHVY
jgi:hypothetical protein